MILLDTHAWIWWAAKSRQLSASARQAIAGEARVGLAAISVWEAAMLVEKGRLTFDRPLEEWIRDALTLPKLEQIPLSPEIAIAAARLGRLHSGDPADWMIVATAQQHRAKLVTKDRNLRNLNVVATVW